VREILCYLSSGSIVLDLGCDQGSFDEAAFPQVVCVRVDLEKPRTRSKRFVQADASRLPFQTQVFDAIICNHSLEHFPELDSVLSEIGRLLKPGGALFASIPDSSSLTDRLYRWLGKGGGHVNQISDVQAFIRKIESKIHLPHRGTRVLLTSLSFLNSKSPTARPMRTLVELGVDPEPLLVVITWLLRNLDRVLRTRMSVSGWLLYFGTLGEEVDERTWANMCVRCGSAHPSAYLFALRAVLGRSFFRHYACPCCGATNLFTPDNVIGNIR
jgi:SAM-dependent methyltransferase